MVVTEFFFKVQFIPLPPNTCGNPLVPESSISVLRKGTAGKTSGGSQSTWNNSADPGGKPRATRWRDLMHLRLL